MLPTSIKTQHFRPLPVNDSLFKGITFFNDANINTKFLELCEKIYSGNASNSGNNEINNISKLYLEKINQTTLLSAEVSQH